MSFNDMFIGSESEQHADERRLADRIIGLGVSLFPS